MTVSTVGVIGAGQMGNGIAHVMSLAGYEVYMNDVNPAALEASLGLIEKNMVRQLNSGRITEAEQTAALARIKRTTNLEELGDCDLIIEAATEDEKIKQKIFDSLLPHLSAHTILTSNTSSISITRLASRTDRPEKFLGFHFMNPVPVMQLVELIRGIATDQET
jgi:3-hydroxybutyryl-CoA dehydrogenase